MTPRRLRHAALRAVAVVFCLVLVPAGSGWAGDAGVMLRERTGAFTPIPSADGSFGEEAPQPSAQTLSHPCRGITDEAARLACFHKICGL